MKGITKKRLKHKIKKVFSVKKQEQVALDNRKIVAYIRVSTVKQQEEGYGLEYQKERINNYCQRNSVEINHTYQDALSGSTNDRSEFNKMENSLKNNEIKVLIAYKLDRLGRTQINVLNFVELLKKNKVKLITLDPEIDYDTPAGEIILSNLTMFAQLERRMIIDRTEGGRLQKINQGNKAQGSILGYMHNKKTKQYEVVEQEKSLVKEVYFLYLKYKGLKKVSDRLNEKGYKTKRRNLFNPVAVYTILTNRFYIGYATYSGKEVVGKHERIINPVLFGRVQAILEKNRKV